MLVIKRMFLSTHKDKTKMFLKEEENGLKGIPLKTDHTSLPAFPVHFHLEVPATLQSSCLSTAIVI